MFSPVFEKIFCIAGKAIIIRGKPAKTALENALPAQ